MRRPAGRRVRRPKRGRLQQEAALTPRQRCWQHQGSGGTARDPPERLGPRPRLAHLLQAAPARPPAALLLVPAAPAGLLGPLAWRPWRERAQGGRVQGRWGQGLREGTGPVGAQRVIRLNRSRRSQPSESKRVVVNSDEGMRSWQFQRLLNGLTGPKALHQSKQVLSVAASGAPCCPGPAARRRRYSMTPQLPPQLLPALWLRTAAPCAVLSR